MGCFSSPSVKATSTWTPGQINYMSSALKQAETGINEGVTPYVGQRVSGPTSLQQQYFGGLGEYGAQGIEALGSIAQSQAPLDAMYGYGQRYAQDVIAPAVMENFAGIGAADSGGAMKGLARELGTYGLGLDAQIGQAALQNQAQQLQAGSLLTNQLNVGGATQYDVANQGLAAQQQAWAEGQPYNNPWYNIGSTLLGTGTTPVQQAGGMGYSMLTSGLGALGGLTALMGNPLQLLGLL